MRIEQNGKQSSWNNDYLLYWKKNYTGNAVREEYRHLNAVNCKFDVIDIDIRKNTYHLSKKFNIMKPFQKVVLAENILKYKL